jgi:hypothetical protein
MNRNVSVSSSPSSVQPSSWCSAYGLSSTESFFEDVAEFRPYNVHFLHDVGAFQVGIGATLALALWRRTDAIFAALAGAGIGSAFHTVAHIRDNDLGGQDSDPFVFGAFTVVLLAAAAWRLMPAEHPRV